MAVFASTEQGGLFSGRCTACSIKRSLCNLVRPTCDSCRRNNHDCDWDGNMGPHVFAMFSAQHNLKGKLGPVAQKQLMTYGAFSDVYRCDLHERGVVTVVAVKIPRKRESDKRLLVLCVREALTWARLVHPNIIPLRGISDNDLSKSICLVADWMDNGNIMDYIVKCPATNRVRLLWDIAKGVLYMHSFEPPIVHGDLKGNNILISPTGDALITDFGLSYVVEACDVAWKNDSSTAIQGNARWLAPERVRPDLYHMSPQDSRTPASDVFSMLRTFLEVLTGEVPFYNERNNFAVIGLVTSWQQPTRPTADSLRLGLSDDLWMLMLQGWHKDPDKRPIASRVEADLRSWSIIGEDGKGETHLASTPLESMSATRTVSETPSETPSAPAFRGVYEVSVPVGSAPTTPSNAQFCERLDPDMATTALMPSGKDTLNMPVFPILATVTSSEHNSKETILAAEVSTHDTVATPDDPSSAVDSDTTSAVTVSDARIVLRTPLPQPDRRSFNATGAPLCALGLHITSDAVDVINSLGNDSALSLPMLSLTDTGVLLTTTAAPDCSALLGTSVHSNSSSLVSDQVTIPVSTTCATRVGHLSSPSWAQPPRVLLVEDDAVSRRLMGKFLQIFGCVFDVAVDGEEAVCKTKGNGYDLVLMDIVMPKLDGLGATTMIREFNKITPIISMTSNSTPGEIFTYYTHGMNDILPKPFNKEGLLVVLEKHWHLMRLRSITPLLLIPLSSSLSAVSGSPSTAPLYDAGNPDESDSIEVQPTPLANLNLTQEGYMKLVVRLRTLGLEIDERSVAILTGVTPGATGGVEMRADMPLGVRIEMTGGHGLFAELDGKAGLKRSIDADNEDRPSKRPRFQLLE